MDLAKEIESLGLADVEVRHVVGVGPYVSFTHDGKKHRHAVLGSVPVSYLLDYAREVAGGN